MKRPVTMVVLTKYPDIWEGFRKNVDEFFNSKEYYRVVVLDGRLITEPLEWKVVYGPKKFSMAGNANLGWKEVNKGSDLLYVGDDVRFHDSNTIKKLSEIAHSDENIGMLSPKIIGGADNDLQKNPPQEATYSISSRYLALVCTFIKREVLDKVGYLDDETFKGYGWEDADYNRRVVNAGFKLAVTPWVSVHHGIDRQGTETFMRNVSGYYEDIQEQCDKNEQAYVAKWGDNRK